MKLTCLLLGTLLAGCSTTSIYKQISREVIDEKGLHASCVVDPTLNIGFYCQTYVDDEDGATRSCHTVTVAECTTWQKKNLESDD